MRKQTATIEEYQEMENARLAKKYGESKANMAAAGAEGRKVEVGSKVSDQVGTVYIVEKSQDADDHEREGRVNTARDMRKSGTFAATLCLRRPKGKKLYYGHQYIRNGKCNCWVMQTGF